MSDMKTKLHMDPHGVLQYERKQDVSPYLDMNKYEESTGTAAKTRFGRKVATIPNIVIEQWMKEGINIYHMDKCPTTRRKIKEKLNSNEWKYLRTHGGGL